MTSRHCQSTGYIERRSALTGRTVRINTELDKFFVPSRSFFQARALAAKMSHWDTKKIPVRVRPLLDAFIALRSNQDFMRAIDELIDELASRETVLGYKTEGVNWLIRLWAEGIIGLPLAWPFSTLMRFTPDVDCCGENSWILEFSALGKRLAARKAAATQMLLKIAGPTQGLHELGDVTFETVSQSAIKAYRARLAWLVTPLLAAQRDKYKPLAPEIIDAWGLGKKRRGFDRSYQWVLEKDTSLSAWREAISGWLNDRKIGYSYRSLAADRFFAYLIENSNLPRSVEEYCRRNSAFSPTWPEWLSGQKSLAVARVQTYRNTMSEFFDWYIDKSLTDEDDFGRPVQSPLHYNPITRVRRAANRSETHREALPLRYIHELIQIITENDFAWPKMLRADYFPSRNDETGQIEKRWSPVRAYAMLVKLYLPLRTFQVRMLDSGEADAERYSKEEWIRNESSLAREEKRSVRRGFLRKFRDTRTEREFTGFYVNTNKTADIYRDERDKGYEVPWQHNEVIAIAAAMRDWQERYNPISAPTGWETLHDKSVLRSHSLEALKSREPVCFLFRDPCEHHPNEPIRGDRMQTFWAALVDELEHRMAATGRTLPDGSPIKLIERRNGGGYIQPIHDLHSLRVSLITAYATEGGVPIHILSKCIAGHATILMTLYYNKPGPAYVTEKMVEAQSRLTEKEQENYLRFLQNEEFRNTSPLVLPNDSSGLSALGNSTPVSWVVGDIGICPVSGTKCHEGGEVIVANSGKSVYAPVAGGAKNCVRCRFFVTGPAFLGGLVAQFNATGLALSEIAESLRRVEQEICEIEDAADDALTDSAQHKRIGLLYERRDRLMDETDQIALNWHAQYQLVERCRAALLASNDQPAAGLSLVLAGTSSDFEVALSECSQFELLDAVCQAGTVYPNRQVPVASLRRGRLLDAMLVRNDRTPVFATLSEREALAAGNEMVTFLFARCGRADTVDIIEGRRMLESTGITKDLEQMLAAMSPLSIDRRGETQRKLYGKNSG